MTLSRHAEPPIYGLILAGGKSSRMRQAKAHLTIHDEPQWRYLARVIAPFCEEVYFSVSPQLMPPLAVARERLIDDVFNEPIGPLGGIISAFRKHPDAALLVLACDLPHVNSEAVQYLLARRNSTMLATAFVHNDKIEPLCALYEPLIKSELARAWAENRLCPRGILAALAVERVELPKLAWLTNLNHPEDVTALHDADSCSVTVHYYATLREQAGRSEETVRMKKGSVGDLFATLKARYGFGIDAAVMRFALNDQIVSPATAIADQATVVFIPPVSGG